MFEEKRPEFDEAGMVRTAQMIVVPLVMGVILFAGIVLFLRMGGQPFEGQPTISLMTLVLGIVLALGIAAGIPTRDGLESWVERQLRRLDEIRSMPRRQA